MKAMTHFIGKRLPGMGEEAIDTNVDAMVQGCLGHEFHEASDIGHEFHEAPDIVVP